MPRKKGFMSYKRWQKENPGKAPFLYLNERLTHEQLEAEARRYAIAQKKPALRLVTKGISNA